MRTFRTKRLALAGGTALLLAGLGWPALGQDRPESILPPGFGDPTPATPAPGPSPRATTAAPTITAPSPGTAVVQPLPVPGATPTPVATATPTPIDPAVLAEYELPAFARRSLARVGPAGAREGALDGDAFGEADGRYLETLMRRLDAPLPSRWASILLRRALAARLTTPADVNGADFAAERAWLLLRMGESSSARAVVQGVDIGNYTPKLYQVAANAMLATGDPGGLCPLADGGVRATGERAWTMAQAMCAALSGDQSRANALIKIAGRRNVANGIDLLLARKVVGAGAQGGQSITIEWDGVDALNVWRFGLATATGVTIPTTLFDTVGRQARYWYALSPSVALGERLASAEAAAAQGVLSSAALIDAYGAVADDDESSTPASATAQDLRTAYTDRNVDARMAAIRQLWGTGRPDYARLVLTARAAVRVPPATDRADADWLVASMLSAGLDRTASRWASSVTEGGDGWAMLMLADPDLRQRVSYRQLAAYAGTGNAALKQQFLFAGLAGLGRMTTDDMQRAAEALDVKIGTETPWTRAIAEAAREGQPGTVALLAAVGMQARDWRGVPAASLYRIVAALRMVGLEGEARMIAAEAITRA